MAKNVQRFPTSVLFAMATGQYDESMTFEKLGPVVSHIFPGIKYWERQQRQIIKDKAAPEIIKQHPRIKDFSNAAEAGVAMGKDLPVAKVERCPGFEWMYPKPTPRAA